MAQGCTVLSRACEREIRGRATGRVVVWRCPKPSIAGDRTVPASSSSPVRRARRRDRLRSAGRAVDHGRAEQPVQAPSSVLDPRTTRGRRHGLRSVLRRVVGVRRSADGQHGHEFAVSRTTGRLRARRHRGPRCGTHCYAAAAAHTTDTREGDHLVEQAARVRAIGVPARPDVPAGPGDTWAPARTPSSSGRSRTTSSAERPGRPRSARHATRRVPEHRVPLGHTRRNHRRPWGSCHLWWTVTTDRAGGDVRRRRTPADPGPSAGERRGPA